MTAVLRNNDTISHLAQAGRHHYIYEQNDRPVPTVVFTPAGPLQGLILACHGGSGHKESTAILAIAEELNKAGYVVVAIDGPVHGERRQDGNLDSAVAIASFRQAWKEGIGRFEIAEDYINTLDFVLQVPEFAKLPVGYIGVSMGTAYGLPLLARERRIAAAVLGLWGSNYVASEHLLDVAKELQCPVWFTQQWHDQAFDRPGTHALFDAIGSEDKRLVAYPGPHLELQGERLSDAILFLKTKLNPA